MNIEENIKNTLEQLAEDEECPETHEWYREMAAYYEAKTETKCKNFSED